MASTDRKLLYMDSTLNRIGKFYDVGAAKAIASLPNVGVDETEMSATAIISTPAWDRQNDSVNPLGGIFDDYAKNPVVYFDHGLDITEPIACSDDKDGKLWLFPSETGIVAKSFFSNRNKLSEQMFFLVADRILRGASLRFNPTERPIKKSQGNQFNRWKMEEWSWTGLAVNPDCVNAVLAKGRINGSTIHGGIMKSLRALAPQPGAAGVRKSGTKITATGSMWPKSLENVMTTKLLGQQVMESAHTHLSEMNSRLKSAIKFVENPKVNEVMVSVEKGIADLVVMIEGGYSESYAKSIVKSCGCTLEKMRADESHMKKYSDDDAKRLESDEAYCKSELAAYEEATEDDDATKMKSFLASSPADRFKISGLATRLDDLAEDESTPEHIRSELKSAVNRIGSIVKSALTQTTQPAAPSQQDVELDAKKKSLKVEIDKLQKRLADAMPCPR